MNRRTLVLVLMWSAAIVAVVLIYLFRHRQEVATRAVALEGAPVRTPRERAPQAPASTAPLRAPTEGPPTMFRMNARHTGQSPFVGPETDRVQWKFETQGAISGQPVVGADGTIYVGSHDHYLYAVMPSGQLKWRADLGDRVYSTPLIGPDGNIYVGSDADVFFSYNPSGELRWRLPTDAGSDADTGSVLTPDQHLLFAAGHDVWCIALDGTVAWRFRAQNKIYTTPAVDDEGNIYVGSQDDHLYALAPDGRMRWSFAAHGDVDSTPALGDDGTIYFGSDDHRVYALTRDGQKKWEADVGGYVRGSVAMARDGTVIVGTFGPRPRVVALDPSSGRERWAFPVTIVDTAEVGVASSPLIDQEGHIYIGAHDDYLYSLSADGHLRWALETDGDIDSSPALAPDGTLYVGSDDRFLYAIR